MSQCTQTQNHTATTKMTQNDLFAKLDRTARIITNLLSKDVTLASQVVIEHCPPLPVR